MIFSSVFLNKTRSFGSLLLVPLPGKLQKQYVTNFAGSVGQTLFAPNVAKTLGLASPFLIQTDDRSQTNFRKFVSVSSKREDGKNKIMYFSSAEFVIFSLILVFSYSVQTNVPGK